MGALFSIHNELGPSLLEKYYQRTVAKELNNQGLSFQQEGYDQKFFKQALAYLRTARLPLAILVNFQVPRLEYKRIINYSR